MYYLTNFHLNLKLVDIIRATKIRIIILITYKLSVNIRILNSILFITHFPYSRGQSRNRAARRFLSFPLYKTSHPLRSFDRKG